MRTHSLCSEGNKIILDWSQESKGGGNNLCFESDDCEACDAAPSIYVKMLVVMPPEDILSLIKKRHLLLSLMRRQGKLVFLEMEDTVPRKENTSTSNIPAVLESKS